MKEANQLQYVEGTNLERIDEGQIVESYIVIVILYVTERFLVVLH